MVNTMNVKYKYVRGILLNLHNSYIFSFLIVGSSSYKLETGVFVILQSVILS